MIIKKKLKIEMQSNLNSNVTKLLSINLSEKLENTSIFHLDKVIFTVENVTSNLNMVLLMIGIITSLLSIYAFLQKELQRRKFNWYLLVLTTFELIFCSTLFIDYLFSKVWIEKIFLHDFNKYTNFIIDFTIHTTDSYMRILTLFLSIDRLYAIYIDPIKVKDFITNVHAKSLISVSFIIIFSLKALSYTLYELRIACKTHAIFCTLVFPFIFNIIPIFVIGILNSILVVKLVKYYKGKSKLAIERLAKKSITVMLETRQTRRLTRSSEQMRRFNSKEIGKTQKSHYFVILTTTIWSILTSIPYYTFNTYFTLIDIKMFSDSSVKNLNIIQIVSSILFNLNHCFNFFIYVTFYNDFRNCILKLFCKKMLSKNEVRRFPRVIRNNLSLKKEPEYHEYK